MFSTFFWNIVCHILCYIVIFFLKLEKLLLFFISNIIFCNINLGKNIDKKLENRES